MNIIEIRLTFYIFTVIILNPGDILGYGRRTAKGIEIYILLL